MSSSQPTSNAQVLRSFGNRFEVELLDSGEIIRCTKKANCPPLVTGDFVICSEASSSSPVISELDPRASLLSRPDQFGKLKPVAANIQQMLILIAHSPRYSANLIDRYIVAAELMSITPILVVNKIDLLDEQQWESLQAFTQIYSELDYPVTTLSCKPGHENMIGNICAILEDKTSIVVGQSGVGKSSLINTVLPKAGAIVGDMSSKQSEGRHTTTQCRLFRLPNGGNLIDSPGIRDFSLWHIDEDQLVAGFKEIDQHAHACKFRNCRHLRDHHCAVQDAVFDGSISNSRWQSFIAIGKSIEQQHQRGLGQSRHKS